MIFQIRLGALIGLFLRNVKIEGLSRLTNKLHVSCNHVQLSNDLQKSRSPQKLDALRQGVHLARNNVHRRPFFQRVTKRNDLTLQLFPIEEILGAFHGSCRGDIRSLHACARPGIVLTLCFEYFIHFVGKGSGLPTKRLSGVEFLIASPSGNNTVLCDHRQQLGAKAFSRKLYPSLVRVGNDDYLVQGKQRETDCKGHKESEWQLLATQPRYHEPDRRCELRPTRNDER
jgi:hypothetical protein